VVSLSRNSSPRTFSGFRAKVKGVGTRSNGRESIQEAMREIFYTSFISHSWQACPEICALFIEERFLFTVSFGR
jgi:hypothetical protein